MNILPNLAVQTLSTPAANSGTPAPAGRTLFDTLILALIGGPAAPDPPAPLPTAGTPEPAVARPSPGRDLPEAAFLYGAPLAGPPPLPAPPAPASSFREPTSPLPAPVLDSTHDFTTPARRIPAPAANFATTPATAPVSESVAVPATAPATAPAIVSLAVPAGSSAAVAIARNASPQGDATSEIAAVETTGFVPMVKNRNKPMSALPAEISFLPEGAPVPPARPEFEKSLLKPLQTNPSELPAPPARAAGTPITTTISIMNPKATPTQPLQAGANVRRVAATTEDLPLDRPRAFALADSASLFASAAEPGLRANPTARVDAPQPVSHPAEVFADAALKMHREGSQRVELTLDLGEGRSLSITIDRRGDSIRPTFHADAPEVRQALEQGWNRVSDRLADHGIRLERPAFDSSPDRDDQSDRARQQHGREPHEESPGHRRRPRPESPLPFHSPAAAPPAKSALQAFA